MFDETVLRSNPKEATHFEALPYALPISPASCQRDERDVRSLDADATSRMKNAYMVISIKNVIRAVFNERMIPQSSNREVFVTNSLSPEQWSLMVSSNPSSHLSADPSASAQPLQRPASRQRAPHAARRSTSGEAREQPVIVSNYMGLCLAAIAFAWPLQ